MVQELNYSSWSKSSITDIYKEYYPSENGLNDLDIKHRDHHKRDKLIDKLKNENIMGWLSSLEGKVDLEICLFPDKRVFDQLMELETVIDKGNDKFDYLNALDGIDLNPSEQFFTQTKDNLKGSPFADYATMVAAWSEDEIKQGLTPEEARHYHLNLRTKFKI